ncbi:MAG: cytidine deaminase [Erysipelotrichaceae bacterium]
MINEKELIALAFKAKENTYSPYSHFPVGACVLCKDGSTFMGANIENASFGLTNCAERSALFAAYSAGYRKGDIESIAIVSDAKNLSAPCGACRQVLNELLSKNTPIYISNGKESVTKTIDDLLPMSFGPDDLDV